MVDSAQFVKEKDQVTLFYEGSLGLIFLKQPTRRCIHRTKSATNRSTP